jgi:hypothetical protein
MNSDNNILTLSYKTDIPNVNGHIYPRKTVRKAFKEYSEKIEKDIALGTLEQTTPFLRHIDVQKVSHKITNITENENDFTITAKILDTPMGKELQDLINKKPPLRFEIGRAHV